MEGIIIGAGIGGLTTALALAQKGIKVNIYEQAPEIRELGAGIIIAPNGLQVFEKLGLANQIIAAGRSIDQMTLTDTNGKTLSVVESAWLRTRHQFTSVSIHRGVLQKILFDAISGPKEIHQTAVFLNKHFKSYSQDANGVMAYFEDGSVAEADFLIMADGIHSKGRKQMVQGSNLRYSGQTCWRFVSQIPGGGQHLNLAKEIWADGRGLRAGYTYIDDNQVYTYITDHAEPGGKDNPDTLKTDLLRRCADFPEPVQQLIKAAAAAAIHRADLYDFAPIFKWVDGKVALMGDAAHATTPNLGQGACQSIEDAYVIAEELALHERPETAFPAYQRRRMPKAHYVTKASMMLAKISNTTGWVKDLLKGIMRLTPSSINEKQFNKIYTLG